MKNLNKISNVSDKTISQIATNLGVSKNKLIDAFKKARIDTVKDSIKKGFIHNKTGKELIDKIQNAIDFFVLPKFS